MKRIGLLILIGAAGCSQQVVRGTHLNMKMFAPLGFVRGLSDKQIKALDKGGHEARTANLPTLEEAVSSGSWLVGTPESIVEKLLEIQDNYPGLKTVNAGQVVGTPENVIVEQLERFGLEYRFISRYLLGKLTLEEMVAKLNTAIHQFAKRQMTFFRNIEKNGIRIHWVNEGNMEKALDIISNKKCLT